MLQELRTKDRNISNNLTMQSGTSGRFSPTRRLHHMLSLDTRLCHCEENRKRSVAYTRERNLKYRESETRELKNIFGDKTSTFPARALCRIYHPL